MMKEILSSSEGWKLIPKNGIGSQLRSSTHSTRCTPNGNSSTIAAATPQIAIAGCTRTVLSLPTSPLT